jgi:imidazolonepropionase-like amidohydrolase
MLRIASKLAFVFFMVLPCITVAAQNEVTIIHAGTVMLIPGESHASEQTIVVSDGMITSVHDGYISPGRDGISNNATVIDLRDYTVMPGFMDMHTHLTGERDPKANPHEWTTLMTGDQILASLPYLERTLMAGFTTVRNVGSYYRSIIPLKRAVTKGLIAGPRIVAATGGVSATGGHGDFHGYNPEVLQSREKNVGICDGADDCRRAVRALVKQGADVIKITATGGVLSNTAAGVGQQLTDDEMAAIVETAHSLGRKVAAHAHEADGINAALRAGVDSIEHGSYLNDESVRLFKQSGAWLVPTLLAGVSVTEELETNDQIPPAIQEKIRQVGPVVEASFKRAVAGGVKIAFGTDSGVSVHGTNGREFELMVSYGMDEVSAIRSATVNTAELLNMSATIGTIEAGKMADIVAVRGDPTSNISLLRNVQFVMKGGEVFKSE